MLPDVFDSALPRVTTEAVSTATAERQGSDVLHQFTVELRNIATVVDRESEKPHPTREML